MPSVRVDFFGWFPRSRYLGPLAVLAVCAAFGPVGLSEDRADQYTPGTQLMPAQESFSRADLRMSPVLAQSIADPPFPDRILPGAQNRDADAVVLPEGRSLLRSLEGRFEDMGRRSDVGPNLYASEDFARGLVISGDRVAMKVGGYVKADMIYDFNAIESTDLFDTTTIPTSGPQRTNTRFHVRQSRLNFDLRWPTDLGPVRAFVEADFFGEGDHWRLRHAYGEVGELIVGQTWTTFTDEASLPTTLDNEGSVSSVNRRQAQVRWERSIVPDFLSVAVSLEDSSTIIEVPDAITGDPRTPTPDLVGRVRLTREWGQFQMAGLSRQLGFQPTGGEVLTSNAWGFNFTGVMEPTCNDKVYYQILFGEGIGSYKGLPDVAPVSSHRSEILPVFAWMVGCTHQWSERWSSNFTYSESRLDNTSSQAGDDLHENTYIALNLIWQPVERFYWGVEYLFGTREDVDGARGEANRLQMSVIFALP
jgi:outer membrane DcaP-like protein